MSAGRVSAALALHKFIDPDATAQLLYAKWLGAAILAKLSRDDLPLGRALTETITHLSPDPKDQKETNRCWLQSTIPSVTPPTS